MNRPLAAFVVCSSVLGWSASALADEASTEQARQAYAQGKEQYEAKDYVAAAASFERSYSLVHSSALLFDIAQAHRLAGRGHCAASRRYYQSYLELEPQAENQREVAERLSEIAPCADAEEQASAEPVPSSANRARDPEPGCADCAAASAGCARAAWLDADRCRADDGSGRSIAGHRYGALPTRSTALRRSQAHLPVRER